MSCHLFMDIYIYSWFHAFLFFFWIIHVILKIFCDYFMKIKNIITLYNWAIYSDKNKKTNSYLFSIVKGITYLLNFKEIFDKYYKKSYKVEINIILWKTDINLWGMIKYLFWEIWILIFCNLIITFYFFQFRTEPSSILVKLFSLSSGYSSSCKQ